MGTGGGGRGDTPHFDFENSSIDAGRALKGSYVPMPNFPMRGLRIDFIKLAMVYGEDVFIGIRVVNFGWKSMVRSFVNDDNRNAIS